MSAKNPFERIISLVDRRKIFARLVAQKTPIVFKLNDGTMASFRGIEVSKVGFNLDGLANEKSFGGAKQRSVVAFFYLEKQRYFVRSKAVKLVNGLWRLMNCSEFYRLNRRDAHRTEVADHMRVTLNVSSIALEPCRVQVRVRDFSSTGIKVRWVARALPHKGDILKGRLVWLNGKEYPVTSCVQHISKEGTIGLQFTDMEPAKIHRFKILSIELQQLVSLLG